MDDGTEDSAVQDFLQILEEHRKNCERQGKYVEAEIAKNRLEELKLHEENRRKEAMRSRQIAERLGVEEAHMLEFQQFNIVWDKKMAQYEQHADELVEAMQVRGAAAPLPPLPRASSALTPLPPPAATALALRRSATKASCASSSASCSASSRNPSSAASCSTSARSRSTSQSRRTTPRPTR